MYSSNTLINSSLKYLIFEYAVLKDTKNQRMTHLTEIKKSLLTLHYFSELQLETFITKLKTKNLAKKEFLLQPEQICDFITFIANGSLRFYSLNNADEITLHFFTENDWVADYESFISQKLTVNYIQALEDTELLIISLQDIHTLMDAHPPFIQLTKLMEKWFIPSAHYISVANNTPDARYKELLAKHPEWINRFPQMYIASYLGMTKETLSRVKARVF
jgi:hypothetical protein